MYSLNFLIYGTTVLATVIKLYRTNPSTFLFGCHFKKCFVFFFFYFTFLIFHC